MRSILFVIAALLPAAAFAQTVESSTVVGTVPASYDSTYTVSPDGRRVAVLKSSGSRRVVSIDGVDGETFDSIEQAHTGSTTGPAMPGVRISFSPDGKHYAYAARRGGDYFMVFDGKLLPGGRGLIFSADSSRYAYIAGDAQTTMEQHVVVDGVVGPAVMGAADLQFSDDGKRFVYRAGIGAKGAQHVVVDGKMIPVAQGFSDLKVAPGGRRYVYSTSIKDAVTPYIDGVAQPTIRRLGSSGAPGIVLSRDGKRFAYVVGGMGPSGHGEQVNVDGKVGEVYLDVDALQFSPDGKRVGFVARSGTSTKNDRAFVVVDGKRVSLEYVEGIRDFKFSPDGKRWGAICQTEAGSFLVVDGKESDAMISVTEFRFTNAGRYVFLGHAKSSVGKPVMYVDGQPVNEVVEISKNTTHFSPDGKRITFSGYRQGGGPGAKVVYLDGKIEPYPVTTGQGQTFWREAVVWSADSQHFAYVAEDPTLTLVMDMQTGPSGFWYLMPTFSPDGKHFAIAGKNPKAKAWTVFLNGKAVTEVDDVPGVAPQSWLFTPDGKLQVLAMKDKEFRRLVINPQGSTLAAFASNSAKIAPAQKTAGKKKGPSPVIPTTASNNTAVGGVQGEIDQAQQSVPDPEAEAQKKVDEANKKAQEALDKKLKKIKGLLGKD